MLKFGLCCTAATVSGFAIVAPTAVVAPSRSRVSDVRMDIDMSVVAGAGALIVGLGGGIGLIALTENAGKRNDEETNQQPCVVCGSKQVTDCTVCSGSGVDQYASLVAGVRAEIGEERPSLTKVTVSDWDEGERTVEMYKEILERYPVKATENQCFSCDGRGVIVCDNCQGSGLQPRFLERYSPDDFMD